MMKLNPYIHFSGNAEAALEYYREALGGELQIMRYGESPLGACAPAGWENKVLHGALSAPAGSIYACDAPPQHAGVVGENFSLAVQTDGEAAAEALFAKLVNGGSVTQPLEPTFFSPRFGMLVDKFGIKWMVLCAGAAGAADEEKAHAKDHAVSVV